MASNTMIEQSGARDEAEEFHLREWGHKSRISRQNTISRRFSASNITSFREDTTTSFRSNFTISSTASSPGYPSFREEIIDPSTYSFTTALKALQARSYSSWECSSPDGFALNSKWNEAEKYICNPLSGEFPMECLSAKTLSGRSFRSSLTNRITMSAPLLYDSSHHSRPIQTKPSMAMQEDHHHVPVPEKKMLMEGMTRDVGTQSTPPDLSSASPSPTSTPSIMERSLKPSKAEEAGDSPNSYAKMKADEEVGVKETRGEEETKRGEGRCRQVGCLSVVSWSWMRKRHREKHKPRNEKNHSHSHYLPFFYP